MDKNVAILGVAYAYTHITPNFVWQSVNKCNLNETIDFVFL